MLREHVLYLSHHRRDSGLYSRFYINAFVSCVCVSGVGEALFRGTLWNYQVELLTSVIDLETPSRHNQLLSGTEKFSDH